AGDAGRAATAAPGKRQGAGDVHAPAAPAACAASLHYAAPLLIDPLARLRRLVIPHPRQHFIDVAAMPQVRALGRVQEALLDHAVDHADQRGIEAFDVQEGAGLVADAQLAPGQHLEDLLHGAEAAGQGDEGVGELEHAHLAFVHGAHDLQLGQAAVGDLPVGQLLGDHAGDLAAGGQHRVGDGAHQADVAAAIDQAQAFLGDAVAEGDGALGIGGLGAGIGAAIDTDRTHGSVPLWGGMRSRAWPGSIAAVAAAQVDQGGQHEEGHAHGAERGASAVDGADDEEYAGGAVQCGGNAWRECLVFHRSAPRPAGTGKTRSRAVARLPCRAPKRSTAFFCHRHRRVADVVPQPREGEVRANGVERWDGIAHAGIRRADAWIHKANPQFALWMARLSTAMAASCTASDRDGWAWQMRARSSAEPLNSMVSTPSCTSSDTFGPIRCMPSTRSVSAWAMTFTKPVGSAMATARPTAANGKVPALYGTPSALSCCSVLPTQAISGPV